MKLLPGVCTVGSYEIPQMQSLTAIPSHHIPVEPIAAELHTSTSSSGRPIYQLSLAKSDTLSSEPSLW